RAVAGCGGRRGRRGGARAAVGPARGGVGGGGCAGALRREGARLVGGNLVAGPHLAITAAVIGEAVGPLVTRAGARPGDRLYVTGALGAAGLAVRRPAARAAARPPDPPRRLAAGRRPRPRASATPDR